MLGKVLAATAMISLAVAPTVADCTAVGVCVTQDGHEVELGSDCRLTITKTDGTSATIGPLTGTQQATFNGVTIAPGVGKTWETVAACRDMDEIIPVRGLVSIGEI